MARAALLGVLAAGLTPALAVGPVRADDAGHQQTASSVPPVAVQLTSTTPARNVLLGAPSGVTAALRDEHGAPVPGVPVQLEVRRHDRTTWVVVARSTSGSDGRAALGAVLSGTSGLRVVHPADGYAGAVRALGDVTVVGRVSSTAARPIAGVRTPQRLSGRVAPAGTVGSPVVVQRMIAGTWRGIAAGHLTSSTSYAARWIPARAGRYRLRVLRAGGPVIATAISPAVTVTAVDTRVSLAHDVLADPGTVLADVHSSGVRDAATARDDLVATAAGRQAPRSSYGNGPGGSVLLDLRVLRTLRRIGQLADVGVSEVAGGSHAPHSDHYAGRALDVSSVNGRPVRPGSAYQVVVRACLAEGATQVFSPSHDPYGGHQNHVHCSFA